GLAHEHGAVGDADEIHRVGQRRRIHEVGPGLAGQPVVPADVGLAQRQRVGVGRGLVADQGVVAAAEHVGLDVGLDLVAAVGNGVGGDVRARRLRVVGGVRVAATGTRAAYRNRAGQVDQSA